MLQVMRWKWNIMPWFTGRQAVGGDLYPPRWMFSQWNPRIQPWPAVKTSIIFWMYYLHICGPYAKRCWKEGWQLLLWHQKMWPVHSAIFKSLCDPGCVTTEGRTGHCRSLARLLNLVCWKHAVFSFTSRKKSEKDTMDSFFVSFSAPHSSLCHHSLPEGGKIPLLTLSEIFQLICQGQNLPTVEILAGCWWEASDESTLKAELLAIPIPSGWFFLLDATEFVVCGIPAVLKFSWDVISSLMGQKGKKMFLLQRLVFYLVPEVACDKIYITK